MGLHSRRPSSRWLTYGILLLGAALVAIPFWYMLVTSLKPQSYIFEIPPKLWPENPTLDNYTTALGRENFAIYFLNSLFVAITATGSTMLISSLLAYAFARLKFPGKEILFYVFLLGTMIPPVMLIIPQFIIAKTITAATGGVLKLLDSLLGLIVVYVTMNLSMQTFLLRGFFEGIPRDLEDAAFIDGANRWMIFRKIILPLSGPGLAVVAISTFLYSWEEFPWAHVAIKETTRRTLPIAIALFQSAHLTEWGQVFAASIVALIPVIIVFVLFQRLFIQGITTTGLKG